MSGIKFITESETGSKVTFGQVEENQMFVCDAGFLCQKVDQDWYNTIADSECEPYCDRRDAYGDKEIRKILPKVIKIEF